ncbi:MAG TPA: efflux RND transporter periplasmic adaptor subunit [Verrucomicrobiae bacterium]
MTFPPLPPRLPAALALALLAASCSPSAGPKSAGTEKPRAVQVALVELRGMERALPVSGTLAAHEQALLSVKVPGRLATVAVDLGSVVRRGDLLARIEPRDYELLLQQAAAALARARAAVGLPLDGSDDRFESETTSVVREAKAVLDEATSNRARLRNLSKSGIASQADLDTVESTYTVALNRFEGAREEIKRRQADLVQRRVEHDIAAQQLADTAIAAPFDGAVGQRTVGVGEFLEAGAPVLTIVRTDPLRLRLEIPERESSGVRAGQRVRLHAEGVERVHTGELARISPLVTEHARVVMAEADIKNDGSLRPGLFARAEIVLIEREDVLAIPDKALITFAGLEKVIVAKAGRAQEKTVTTGRHADGWVEIVRGLERGEQVVLSPGNLRTGQAIEIGAAASQPGTESAATTH